jgi:threonine/homoserine/homoserine lactone efflux protein
MDALLPPLPLLGAFLAASLVLAVTPGPAVFYIVTRSVSHGRLSGLASVGGVALGNLGNAIGASLGLAALFAISSVAFTVVKYLGALYLIWLGVQTLRGAGASKPRNPAEDDAALRRTFVDGFLVALLNPKTAIFFAAFLPQFVHGPAAYGQTITLGVLFVLIAATTDSLYALCAGAVRPRLARASRLARCGRYVTASAFIGLGVLTAVSGQRTRS